MSTQNEAQHTISPDSIDSQKTVEALHHELSKKTKAVQIIQEISAEINATLNLEEILDIILKLMDRVFEFHHSMILLLDESGEKLHCAASFGFEESGIGAKVSLGQGIIGVVAKRKKLIRMGNIGSQLAYQAAIKKRMVESGQQQNFNEVELPGLANVQSQMAFPLLVKGQLIGVFSIESPLPNAFDALDELLVNIVANQVASALNNARLYNQLKEQTKDLQLVQNQLLQINQIHKQVSQSLELQQVSRIFIEKAVQTTSPDGSGSILLFEEEKNTFAFYASYGLDSQYVRSFEIEASPDTLYTYEVVITKRGKIFNEEELDRFQNEETAKLHYGKRYVQQLVVPLVAQDKTIGLVTISHYDPQRLCNESDLQFLENIANNLSNHFENARLYTHVTHINQAIERFVPHEFMKLLDKNSILEVKLGDQVEKKMTILFSDIRSFTTLSETMTPEENFRFINSYLRQMGPLIQNHHGFIDKFIGDAIMALFDKNADDAVQTAIEMLQRLDDYNVGRKRVGYQPIKIGIGINTGMLMLGTLGNETRMEGTVIGDAVNLASRLEGLTKLYGSSLLISEGTLLALETPNSYTTRFIDRVKVKGKTKAATIYEVIDADAPEIQERKLATVKTYEQAWQAYQIKKFEEAKNLFEQCLKTNPQDQAAQVYKERCLHYLQVGCEDDWEGITSIDFK